MKQIIEIEVPEGKKAIWKDDKIIFEDIAPKLPETWEEFCKLYPIKEKEVFIDQIKLADQLKLPIIIHVRDAIGDLIELLKSNQQYLNNGGIIHCFNESIESYKILKGLGFKFSFGGAITFKNSKNAPKLLETVDINDILLETDSPYLTPEPLRGKERNQPKYVKYVAEKIAEYFKNHKEEHFIVESKLPEKDSKNFPEHLRIAPYIRNGEIKMKKLLNLIAT